MKFKFFLPLIIALFVSVTAQAGDASVKGVIIDKNTKETLPMATVQLFVGYESKPRTGMVTDTAGAFLFSNLEYGNYRLEISYVGYESRNVLFSLTYAENNVNLRRIRLKPDEAMLQEITVVGHRSSLQMDIDKKVFLVNENAHTEGISASEILKVIPSVDIDAEGTVTLRNNEAVEVQINGKSSGLTADNQGEILEQLPAGSIEKVEIITNPSAKHNAEGSAGIINIILKENREMGYFGSVSADLNYPWESKIGGSLSGNISYSTKKVDLTASVGYSNRNNTGDGYTDRQHFGADTTFLRQDEDYTFKMNSGFLRLGTIYKINYRSNLSASGMVSLGDRNRENDITYLRGNFINGYRTNASSMTRFNNNEMDRKMFSFSVDFDHKFDRDGEKISTSIGYSGNYRETDADYVQMSFDQSNTFIAGSNSIETQENDEKTNNYYLQCDYVNPYSLTSKYEIGYKSTFMFSNNESDSYIKEGYAMGFIPQYGLFNDFDYNQNIHALYASYGTKISKVSTSLGLRGELTEINWEQNLSNEKDDKDPYFDLFPTVFLGYSFSKTNELQLSYTRRINRPRSRFVNPYHNVSDAANVSFGNPDINPEYTNSFELNYIKSFENHTITSSLYYKRTNDVIQNYSWMEDETMMRTFANLSTANSSGFDLVLRNRFKRLTLTSSADIYYYLLEGGKYTLSESSGIEGVSQHNVTIKERSSLSWTARITADITFPANYLGQISGNYSSPKAIAQGKTLSNYQVNASVKKSFFERKLTAALGVRDIFNSRNRKTETWSDDFDQTSESHRNGRTLNFNLTYRFGNNKMSKDKEKKGQNEENKEEEFDDEF
ncbi:MAG: TonB-dependent receptor [Paludibacteraceae bacterium]|nr:TonB-dependent receptor [Paludibacteraceae bacterium]